MAKNDETGQGTDQTQDANTTDESAESTESYSKETKEELKKAVDQGKITLAQLQRVEDRPQCLESLRALAPNEPEHMLVYQCIGIATDETTRGYQTQYGRDMGAGLADLHLKIAEENLDKEQALDKTLSFFNNFVGGEDDEKTIKESDAGDAYELDDKSLEKITNLILDTREAKSISDKSHLVRKWKKAFEKFNDAPVKGVSKVEKLAGTITRKGLTDDQLEREIKSKISGHFGAFKRTTSKSKQAKHMKEMLDLKERADDMQIALPPNIQMLLADEARVEDILTNLQAPSDKEGIRDALVKEPTRAIDSARDTVEDLAGGMPDTDDRDMVGIAEEAESLATDVSKTGEVGLPDTSYLGRESVGTGKLFDAPISDKEGLFNQRMTDVQQQDSGDFVGAEVQRMKVGEEGLFQAMPVESAGRDRAFEDIKGLVTQTEDVHGHKEFLAERAAGKGALAGIAYRPTAGIVGATTMPGGSRWFDFPQQGEQRTKINLGIQRADLGPDRPALSLLGRTTKMGGGGMNIPFQAGAQTKQNQFQQIQGASTVVPTNQFGANVQKELSAPHGTLASFASNGQPTPTPQFEGRKTGMTSLLGEPITPKRKKDMNAVRKLNLFGKLPRY